MNEIAKLIRPDEKQENFERAYYLACSDFFASVGSSDLFKWRWLAMLAGQN